ncbi:hypothetical protein TRIP_B350540 [uncultured Desulfatiglans sp.]|uniref:Uncharacterized protein n=1 Tax=Uncultured Desulfatiglans sp. TaxID=1748965 RepID=A0A653ACE5_UNCDX|nr:hypothetical protein TRIP_B350540 [uncultured Desulfatiglans sp.]
MHSADPTDGAFGYTMKKDVPFCQNTAAQQVLYSPTEKGATLFTSWKIYTSRSLTR